MGVAFRSVRGMPPHWMDVVHRRELHRINREEVRCIYHVRGHHPHEGRCVSGWSGPETLIVRDELVDTGRWESIGHNHRAMLT